MKAKKLVDITGYFKRAIGILLSVALLFSWCVGGACRVEATVERPAERSADRPAGEAVGKAAEEAAQTTAATTVARTSARESAAARLGEGLLACAPAIDLTDCRLPATEVGALYASVLYDDPALFHVAPRLSYATEVVSDAKGQNALFGKGNSAPSATIVTVVYPTYTLTGAALTEARALYRAAIGGMLADMEAAFGGHAPCEAAVALYLHDVLADRYAYDTRTASPEAGASAATAPNADAYRFFRDGVGICQAYALAYMALCRAAGLEVCFVSSTAMNHAWNHVRVDGRWYHVDVTRDDPIVDAPVADDPVADDGDSAVTHTRLLRSDEGMAALGYADYTCPAGHACTDRRYEVAGGVGGGDDRNSDGDSPTADATPLGVFQEALTPVWTGKELIFVANLHGSATVAPRSRYGEIYGENAISATNRRATAVSAVIAAVYLTPDGVIVTAPADLDGDGTPTPGDLLLIYDPTLPEAWRQGVRAAVVSTLLATGDED